MDNRRLLRLVKAAGLDRWRWTFSTERLKPEEGNIQAAVEIHDLVEHAIISVCPGWEQMSMGEQDLALAHEVSHILLCDLDNAFAAAAKGLEKQASKIAKQMHSLAEERTCWRLARILVVAAGMSTE